MRRLKKTLRRICKGKKAAGSSKRLTVARPAPALRQTTIPTGLALREKVVEPSVAVPATSAAPAEAPLSAVLISQVSGQPRRKRARPTKEVDFLGVNTEEPVKEVLEALPPETAAVAVVHNKYWVEEWKDYTASYTVEDLVAANCACIARALGTSVQLEDLIKDLSVKNIDLAKLLEEAMQYEDEVRAAQEKAYEAESTKQEAEGQLIRVNADVERLKKELHETECQVAAVTRRSDHANEYHRLTTSALEASYKEKAELKQWAEAQAEEIASLKGELKSAGEVAVQNFIDHFEEHPLYDDFANYWASWSAQELLGQLKEIHPTLDISSLQTEFNGPTRG
ncbi:uncharacterized protein LOC111408217 [Olea europaea var. sylvestris]|uniref:uncharacterized protein LOC111408217 n=1 Tax=Olea europaea var. sylvestris TaxID=158386 RepID=UPI000C1D34AF|nr:uncharacterized protein LOC111408217 [Olea europaea var. sylvestris]